MTTGLLVGYGSIGRRHLANLQACGVTDWAVVHTGNSTVAFAPPAGTRVYRDLASALRAEAPDFAVVANPTSLHIASTIRCLEEGCPVLVEKPLGASFVGAQNLRAAAAATAVPVLVGFQYRLDSGLQEVRRILASGVLGHIGGVDVRWSEHLPDWHPWEDWTQGYAARADLGGGVHHTLSHPFDYLRMLFGDLVVDKATLTIGAKLALEVAEAADVTLRTGDGIPIRLRLDYWGSPTEHRMRIEGSSADVVWDYVGGSLRIGNRTQTMPGLAGRDELFRAEARHFLDVVAGTAQPACGLEDGLAALALCVGVDAAAGNVVPNEP